MTEKNNKKNNEDGDITWRIPEYHSHDRSQAWYLIAIGMCVIFMIYAFWTANFLFAILIIVAAVIYILKENEKTIMVKVTIGNEGITIGQKLYDYDELKDFLIIYKPKQNIKKLYFEFKNPVKQRLSINLEEINPLQIRKKLLKYLAEDLESTDEPLSETLAKIFKL